MSDIGKAVAGVLTGGLLGIAMEKGGVAFPTVITGQMELVDFRVLKLFMAAMGSSAAVLGAMGSGWLGSHAQEHYNTIRAKYAAKKQGLLSNALGGAILGTGMAIGGACPGTVLAQIGAGVPLAGLTGISGLLGAFLFHLLGSSELDKKAQHTGPQTLDSATGASPGIFGLGVLAGTLAMAIGLDSVVRGPEPAFSFASLSSLSLQQAMWSPIAAGLCFGIIQLPSLLSRGQCLGAASAYSCVLAPGTSLVLPSMKDYADLKLLHLVTFNLGIVGGAYYSSISSGTFGTGAGVGSPTLAALSGLLVVYGGRLAGGCTSGHGVSGTGLLNVPSFVVAASIFGGGIAARLSLKSMGML